MFVLLLIALNDLKFALNGVFIKVWLDQFEVLKQIVPDLIVNLLMVHMFALG